MASGFCIACLVPKDGLLPSGEDGRGGTRGISHQNVLGPPPLLGTAGMQPGQLEVRLVGVHLTCSVLNMVKFTPVMYLTYGNIRADQKDPRT